MILRTALRRSPEKVLCSALLQAARASLLNHEGCASVPFNIFCDDARGFFATRITRLEAAEHWWSDASFFSCSRITASSSHVLVGVWSRIGGSGSHGRTDTFVSTRSRLRHGLLFLDGVTRVADFLHLRPRVWCTISASRLAEIVAQLANFSGFAHWTRRAIVSLRTLWSVARSLRRACESPLVGACRRQTTYRTLCTMAGAQSQVACRGAVHRLLLVREALLLDHFVTPNVLDCTFKFDFLATGYNVFGDRGAPGFVESVSLGRVGT